MSLRATCLAFVLSVAGGEAMALTFTGGIDDGFGGGVDHRPGEGGRHFISRGRRRSWCARRWCA